MAETAIESGSTQNPGQARMLSELVRGWRATQLTADTEVELWRMVSGIVDRFIKKQFPNISEHDREDIVQDTVSKLFRKGLPIENPDKAVSYIVKSAKSVALSFLRTRSNRARIAPTETVIDGGAIADRRGDGPGAAIERAETCARVRESVKQLSPVLAETVTVHLDNDLPPGKVLAATLRIKEGTVKSRLFNICRALSELLKDVA
jgi:DNA-directed RNA polymerase specialized sigma24 family protein